MAIISLLNCHQEQLSSSPEISNEAVWHDGRMDGPGKARSRAPALSSTAGVKPLLLQYRPNNKTYFPQDMIISRLFRASLITLFTSVALLFSKSTQQVSMWWGDPSQAGKGDLRSVHIMASFSTFLERNSHKTGPGMPNSSKPVIKNCLQEGDELLLKWGGKYS